MFKFSLTSASFNTLLRRLLLVGGSDKTATITFKTSESKLKIYYRSKIDKTDTQSLFYEELTPESLQGEGQYSIFISNLFNIKIPDATEDKYPFCKEVEFKFNKQILDVNFSIKWNKLSGENKTSVHLPLLAEQENLEDYNNLFNDTEDFIKIDSKIITNITMYCNFIKNDITSKEGNGTLLYLLEDNLIVVATDSSVAVRLENKVHEKNITKPFKPILSPTILVAIKNFLSETEVVKIFYNKSHIILESEGKRMLAPVMQIDFIFENPEELFTFTTPFIGSLDIKPLLTVIGALTANSTDIYNKIVLEIKDSKFNLKTDINKTNNLPIRAERDATIAVNSEFFTTALTRILNLGLNTHLYYEPESHRITLSTVDNRLVFLIQGLEQ